MPSASAIQNAQIYSSPGLEIFGSLVKCTMAKLYLGKIGFWPIARTISEIPSKFWLYKTEKGLLGTKGESS